jgi:type I restriction enzyme S subunit
MVNRTKPSWPQKPLSEIVDLNPRLDKSAYQDNLEVSFVPMAAVEAGSGRMEVSQTKPFGTVKKGYTPFKEGDVLFAKITPCMENGKMGIVPKLVNDLGFGSTEFHVLRPHGEIDPRYIYYFVSNQSFRRDAAHQMTGAVGQKRVPQSFLEEALISVPLPEEQRSIVAEIEKQFSRLDEAVASLKRIKANLKRYKTAVLKAAVEGKLVSTDAGNWIRTNLGAVLTAIEAGKSFKCEERVPNSHEIGVVKVSAVTWGSYDEQESKTCLNSDRVEARYFVRPGDFLFSRANTIELVGACVIAHKVTRKIMLSDKILRFHFVGEVLPQWVLYWLRSDIGRMEIQCLATGNQESMRNIGQDRIRQIAFAFPSLDEQREVVDEVERRLSVIEELQATVEANLTRADRLRQSILSQAFSGKLVFDALREGSA